MTGIELTDRAIKIAKLTKQADQDILVVGDAYHLPPGIIKNGEIMNDQEVASALAALNDKHHLGKVAISLPLGEIVHRGPKSLAESLAKEQVAIDYAKAADSAGLDLIKLDLKPKALARSLLNEPDKTKIIIDLGDVQTDFYLVRKGEAILAASIDYVSGEAMVRTTADNLGFSETDAKKHKQAHGLIGKLPIAKILKPLATLLGDESDHFIKSSLHTYDGELAASDISEIILTGENATMPGLADFLANRLGIQVRVGNPWVNLRPFERRLPPIPLHEALTLSTPIGLALPFLE